MTTISRTENNRRAKPVPADAALPDSEPDRNCPLCPRLVSFRDANRAREPEWFNAPVPSFGDPNGRLLIVGLAPGMQGANRTGRPFARGVYQARPDDGFTLVDCRIGNAVHCVPPQNKPLPAEINTCRRYLANKVATMPNLRAIMVLGRIAHDSTLKVLGLRAAEAPFSHGAVHRAGALKLYDSYHCSRYNTNTRVLTPEMFRSVFANIRAELG